MQMTLSLLYRSRFYCKIIFHTNSVRYYSASRTLCRETANYFITTPIFYVNAAPHIGHLYSCVLADAAARYYKLKGRNILFSTGTDEHGLKIHQAAESKGQLPQDFVAQVSSLFRAMFDAYNIGYTDYIRTTEQRHHNAVEHMWRILKENGYIYKGKYEGWYSISDEAFVRAIDVTDGVDKNGNKIKVSVESGRPVTWMEEDNYVFALSKLKDKINQWLDTGAVQPNLFEPRVRQWVSELTDFSVSRARNRLSWGIPVPGDNSQTIYVWLDALVNYLSVSGFPEKGIVWPVDCHVVGKDILKFHAVYWPAFLMAAELEPPKKIFCHSHWLIDNVKMSKSLGNVVDPMAIKEKYSAEVFRYYLLREGVPHQDGNYNEQKGMEYVNADIVNSLGNLLARITAPAINPDQMYPKRHQETYIAKFSSSDRETFENLDTLVDIVEHYYSDLLFSRGIESIMSYIRWANGVMQHHQPWVLVKSSEAADQNYLKTVIHIGLDTLRVCGILLQPIIPIMAERLLNRLGIPPKNRTLECAKKPYLNSPQMLPLGPDDGVLLKRLQIKKP